jgi:hypothetical protein
MAYTICRTSGIPRARLITKAASSRDSACARIVTTPLSVRTSNFRDRSCDWSAIFDFTDDVIMASVVRAVGCSGAGRSVGLTTINPDSNRTNTPPWSRREKSDSVVSAAPAALSRPTRGDTRAEVCVMVWRVKGCGTVAWVIEYLALVRLSTQPQKQVRVVAPRTTMRKSDLRMPGFKSHQELTPWT